VPTKPKITTARQEYAMVWGVVKYSSAYKKRYLKTFNTFNPT
jgi:hypothetical protein